MPQAYSADWLFPGDGPAIPRGVVIVDQGRIAAVERSAPTGVPLQHFEHCALLPGLVNAHTHLEFSALPSPLEPRTCFPEWIRAVVSWRREQPLDINAHVQGVTESQTCGTSVIGEIATREWLDQKGFRPPESCLFVAFRELLGLRPEATAAQLEIAEQHLRQPASPGIVRGLSPHAPYSVHPQLLNRLMMLAQEHAVPVAMHLAETRDELELLDSGTGPLVDLLNDFGVWDPEFIPRGSKPLDYLRPLSQAERGLVIHGNYLSDEELDFLTRHPQLSVVYCPRTHAAMGHPPHPWQAMQQRGINVCIGTDSRASNPDLSIWEELRLLQGLAPELPASEILKFGTSNGAQALGISASHGRLAPGLNAQLLLASLSPTALSDPELHLFREPASSLKWVDSSSSR